MNIYQKLAIATTGAALSCTAIDAKLVQAAMVNYNFTVDNLSGPLSGNTGSGSFSYDDSSLSGKGDEFITLSDNFKFNFNFLGRTYTEADEYNYPDPNDTLVSYVNGKFNGLFYGAPPSSTLMTPGIAFLPPDVFLPPLGFTSAGSPGTFTQSFSYDSGSGDVTYKEVSATVPEPSFVDGAILASITSAGYVLKNKLKKSR